MTVLTKRAAMCQGPWGRLSLRQPMEPVVPKQEKAKEQRSQKQNAKQIQKQEEDHKQYHWMTALPKRVARSLHSLNTSDEKTCHRLQIGGLP